MEEESKVEQNVLKSKLKLEKLDDLKELFAEYINMAIVCDFYDDVNEVFLLLET